MAARVEPKRSANPYATLLSAPIRSPQQPTGVDHMFNDFEQNINEDDLTHLPEILGKHDLTMDFAAGSKQDFHRRSLETSLIDVYTIMFLMNTTVVNCYTGPAPDIVRGNRSTASHLHSCVTNQNVAALLLT
jgi:hypothetical protein